MAADAVQPGIRQIIPWHYPAAGGAADFVSLHLAVGRGVARGRRDCDGLRARADVVAVRAVCRADLCDRVGPLDSPLSESKRKVSAERGCHGWRDRRDGSLLSFA